MTAPQMFAAAVDDVPCEPGPHRCYYCGGTTSDILPAARHVKKTFTARDTVAGGDYVCGGCVAAMDERADIVMADGERKTRQKVRCYSWLITEHEAIAASKKHREWLLEKCLHPPAPPFVLSISDSGQKHLLYRAVVSHSRERPTVTLEAERITYAPEELRERLALCKRIAAVLGKPALSESLSFPQQMSVIEYHDDETMVTQWDQCVEDPLTRLAIWFTPAKKECEHEYPPHDYVEPARVQRTLGWAD